MPAVIFDPADFREQYPEFSSLSDGVLNRLFSTAILLVDNGEYSVISDLVERKALLYLVVAHLAFLSYGPKGAGAVSGGVQGRINSVTQGSVSVGSELLNLGAGAEWWQLSSYGALFWMTTMKYRVGSYTPDVYGTGGFFG